MKVCDFVIINNMYIVYKVSPFGGCIFMYVRVTKSIFSTHVYNVTELLQIVCLQ